jgi:hypothetical protein
MNSQELKQRIDKIEECADDAKRAVQGGNVPADLRESVDMLHQQASQAKQNAGAQSDQDSLRQAVMQLEQTADRAKQACRNAGSQLDAQTQQAVQRAHDEVSNLKKEMQAGSPA